MKQRLINSSEVDWVSRWRHFYGWKPGTGKYIKRGMNKRIRKEGKNNEHERSNV